MPSPIVVLTVARPGRPTRRRSVDLTGNRVVEDIGGGRFAVYAHLQQHGVPVHPGDRVRRGAALGRVGNSGGSSEPHLHFHVIDAASRVAGNAVPFGFDAFRPEGAIHDFETGEVTPLAVDITGFGR